MFGPLLVNVLKKGFFLLGLHVTLTDLPMGPVGQVGGDHSQAQGHCVQQGQNCPVCKMAILDNTLAAADDLA